jgi:hypothetical protein
MNFDRGRWLTDEVGYEEEYVLLLLDVRVHLLQSLTNYGMAVRESLAVGKVFVLHSAPLQAGAVSCCQVGGWFAIRYKRSYDCDCEMLRQCGT